ncbi:MAG: hypothetical protein ACP5RJ_09070, partial [Conexivisphaera sp.]
GFSESSSSGQFGESFNEAKNEFWEELRSLLSGDGGAYLLATNRGEKESEEHYLMKALVVRWLAARKGLEHVDPATLRDRIPTEKRIGDEVCDACDPDESIVYEVETLYGEAPFPIKKLQETVDKWKAWKVRVVLDPFCASIHLPEVLSLARILGHVEFYAASVEGNGNLIRVEELAKQLNNLVDSPDASRVQSP